MWRSSNWNQGNEFEIWFVGSVVVDITQGFQINLVNFPPYSFVINFRIGKTCFIGEKCKFWVLKAPLPM